MNGHLAVKIDDLFLALPEDASVDIEDTNPYLNDTEESYSYQFEVPIEGNREILGDIDAIQSDIRLVGIENRPMTIYADGIAIRNGKVATAEDQEITDRISISMTSNVRTLSDYYNDLECRDIPVKDDIQIGEMIGNVVADYEADISFKAKSSGKTGFMAWSSVKRYADVGKDHTGLETELPALGFSQPFTCAKENALTHVADGENGKDPTVLDSFINVSDPYPVKPYANARVCYMHYKKNDDGTSSDMVDNSANGTIDSKFNPYLVLSADRQQSGICFYVLYFLDCLFHYLSAYGISYDGSELAKVSDLCRLVFFTTRCKYDLRRKYDKDIKDNNGTVTNRVFDFTSLEQINNWLSSRNCHGRLEMHYEKSKSIGGLTYNGTYYTIGSKLPGGEIVQSADFIIDNFDSRVYANIMRMYANSQNFPDASVSSVIDSLWASFGIRFYLNQETMKVTAFFIRDLLRDDSAPIEFHGEVFTAFKESEKITGFRMKYSNESSRKEQLKNITEGIRDYDTDYDYCDYSRINTSLTYYDIIQKSSISDLSCYVDITTGNRYRIKINGEADTVKEYHPVIFEVGQYHNVEIGDCSDESQDFVEEVESSFAPVNFNDVNGRNEKNCGSKVETEWKNASTGAVDVISAVNAGDRDQVLAAFIDEEMWHENCERQSQTAFGSEYADVYLREICTTRESFDNTKTDDGSSPLQNKDWGLAIAIMRGGGADAEIERYDYNYDGFGSWKWRTSPGVYGMSSDSIDCWGEPYDYNGKDPGIGEEDGRFSLKIRAYANDPKTGEPMCNAAVARRGLYDTFMAEYAHFILNRKKVKITLHCEVPELMNIQWNKRYNIGGYVGWINKINTHITAANGIESVDIEMYIL